MSTGKLRRATFLLSHHFLPVVGCPRSMSLSAGWLQQQQVTRAVFLCSKNTFMVFILLFLIPSSSLSPQSKVALRSLKELLYRVLRII